MEVRQGLVWQEQNQPRGQRSWAVMMGDLMPREAGPIGPGNPQALLFGLCVDGLQSVQVHVNN